MLRVLFWKMWPQLPVGGLPAFAHSVSVGHQKSTILVFLSLQSDPLHYQQTRTCVSVVVVVVEGCMAEITILCLQFLPFIIAHKHCESCSGIATLCGGLHFSRAEQCMWDSTHCVQWCRAPPYGEFSPLLLNKQHATDSVEAPLNVWLHVRTSFAS